MLYDRTTCLVLNQQLCPYPSSVVAGLLLFKIVQIRRSSLLAHILAIILIWKVVQWLIWLTTLELYLWLLRWYFTRKLPRIQLLSRKSHVHKIGQWYVSYLKSLFWIAIDHIFSTTNRSLFDDIIDLNVPNKEKYLKSSFCLMRKHTQSFRSNYQLRKDVCFSHVGGGHVHIWWRWPLLWQFYSIGKTFKVLHW